MSVVSPKVACHDADAPTPRVIIGIDPGLHRTGYAVVAAAGQAWRPRLLEAGVVRLDPRQRLENRLVELGAGLRELLAKFQPSLLACEELYAHYKHPRTAILMGHARGVILATCAGSGLEVRSLAATLVKKLLTGSGRAGKPQVQRAVAATLQLAALPEPHDVADAIAIALSGLWIAKAGAAMRQGAGAGETVCAAAPARRARKPSLTVQPFAAATPGQA